MIKIYAIKDHGGAYLLLKHALGVDTLDIKKTPSGKPYIDGDIYFNISHSHEYAVCAVADVPVGIDIELIRPVSERVRKRFLNDCPPEDAIREWTRRESYGKMTGEGFMYKSGVPHMFKEYGDIEGYVVMVCVSRPDGFVTPHPVFPEKITWYNK